MLKCPSLFCVSTFNQYWIFLAEANHIFMVLLAIQNPTNYSRRKEFSGGKDLFNTLWPQQMDDILVIAFSNAFEWKCLYFDFIVTEFCLGLKVQFTIRHYRFRQWLAVMMRNFDVFFDLHLSKRLSKQSRRRWFETPSHSLWCHCNVTLDISGTFSGTPRNIQGNLDRYEEHTENAADKLILIQGCEFQKLHLLISLWHLVHITLYILNIYAKYIYKLNYNIFVRCQCGWGLGAFLRWWPPSTMWSGPLIY